MTSKYKKPDWAIDQIIRCDWGCIIVEDICKHGVGHPNKDWLKEFDPDNKYDLWRHGCCKEKCCEK